MNKYGYKLIPMGYARFANHHQFALYKYEIYQWLDMKWRLIHESTDEDFKWSSETDAKNWIESKIAEDNGGIVEYP